MKQLTFTLLCAAALVCAASCQKEFADSDGMVPVTISASLPDTKVAIDGVSPKWQSGDKIAVFTTDGTLCPAFSTTDGGSQSATFSGSKPDGSTLGVAVYPYDAAVSMSGSTVTINIPSEQDGKAANAVMAAPAGESFNFQNLLSVVKLNIPSSLDIRKVEILREAPASGKASFNTGTMVLSAASDAGSSVSVSTGSTLSGEVFVSMLPASSTKVEMILTNGRGKMALISKNLTSGATAGRIKDLGSVPSSLSFSDVALLSSATSAQSYSAATQPSKPQITNGDFETWTVDGANLPNNWNSFQTAGGSLAGSGYDKNNRQVRRESDTRPGTSGNYSCLIWSRRIYISILGIVIADVVAQGNLTTGQVIAGNMTASGTGNYNMTNRGQTHNATGNPLYSTFTGRPDSLAVWVKFIPYGTDSSHPYAKVEAFLHDNNNYQRGYNASDCTGGTVIGEAGEQQLQKTNGAWKRLSLPFTYSNSSNPSYALINIATNSYPGGGNAEKNSSDVTKADRLYIDDIEMVYNLYNVKTDASGWATLYLGYDALVPSGVTVYYVNKAACGYASLVPVYPGNVLPKNTAVLVKGSANTTYAFNGRGADVDGKARVNVSGNLLKGTLVDCSKPSGTCRVLSGESSSSMAVFGNFSGSTLKANTAWLAE